MGKLRNQPNVKQAHCFILPPRVEKAVSTALQLQTASVNFTPLSEQESKQDPVLALEKEAAFQTLSEDVLGLIHCDTFRIRLVLFFSPSRNTLYIFSTVSICVAFGCVGSVG